MLATKLVLPLCHTPVLLQCCTASLHQTLNSSLSSCRNVLSDQNGQNRKGTRETSRSCGYDQQVPFLWGLLGGENCCLLLQWVPERSRTGRTIARTVEIRRGPGSEGLHQKWFTSLESGYHPKPFVGGRSGTTWSLMERAELIFRVDDTLGWQKNGGEEPYFLQTLLTLFKRRYFVDYRRRELAIFNPCKIRRCGSWKTLVSLFIGIVLIDCPGTPQSILVEKFRHLTEKCLQSCASL